MNSQPEDLIQKRQVRDRYNYEVKRYEASRFGSPGGRLFDLIEKNYASRFLISGSVLHVGTATGRFVSYLSKLGFHYTGLEISDLMVEATKTRISREAVVADIIQADGENPPIRPSSFDNVLSVRSFHFFPEPDKFLKSAYEILRPGGRVIASFELHTRLRHPSQFLRILPEPLPRRNFYVTSDVARKVRNAGFRVIWAGKPTKLPLLGYWRLISPLVPLLRKTHARLPNVLGTVGLVVGEKPYYDGDHLEAE